MNKRTNISSSIFLLISTIFIFSCNSKKDTAEYSVKGKIINPVRDFIEFKKKTASSTLNDTIKLDKNGEFMINVTPDTLTAYTLVYGDDSKSDTLTTDEAKKTGLIIKSKTEELNLMLDKGYSLEISFDTKNPLGTLIIAGNGSEYNMFVTKKEILNRDFNLRYAKMIKANPEEFLKFIDEYKNNIDNLINELPKTAEYLPNGFKEQEQKNNQYSYYRLKLNYAKQNIANNQTGQFLPDDNYFSFISDIPFDNSSELSNPTYMLLINTYIDYLLKKENKNNSLQESEVPIWKYETLKELFPNTEARELVLFEYLKRNVKFYESEWFIQAINDFNKYSASDSLKKELTKLKETREKLSQGNSAPDFTYPDISGQDHSLTDYKGKYVYIDVWATWCKPCLYEIPFLKQLEEDYRNRNIIFISVSIDEDYEKWKKMVSEKDMQGIQIIASDPESKIRKDYMIGGIPRFIFIGPGGEIIDNDATRPSDDATREMFESFSGL